MHRLRIVGLALSAALIATHVGAQLSVGGVDAGGIGSLGADAGLSTGSGTALVPDLSGMSGGATDAADAAATKNAQQAQEQQQEQQDLDAEKSADTPTDQGPSATRVKRRSRGSQFQRFVQESTGRRLPVYGMDLFDNPGVFAPNTGLPAPADYVLGPGDEVRVRMWGAVDYSGNHTLDRNGQITLPKVGVVKLAGVNINNLDTVLHSQLGKVFANFGVNGTTGKLRSFPVYVVGHAQQPGTYNLSGMSTLVSALFASGGPTANGSMRNIQLKRGSRVVTTIDLYDFIARGDKSQDVLLQPGDVIVVYPVGPRVAVTGAFDHAAIYELKGNGTTVGDVLSIGGGVPTLATPRKALLERVAPEKNPPRQVQDMTLDPAGLKTALRDGDVLTLLGISPAFANAVTLQGTVAAPLRYPWFEGMRVLDLIPNQDALITGDYYRRKNLLVQNDDAAKAAGAGVQARVKGLADQINWEYAVIERMDKERLATELIPFNLGKAVLQRDPTQNLPLLPGDVVTVLSHHDLRLPQERQTRLVRVEGEVAAPGVYHVQAGETLPQLLQRVGGLTAQAYLFGAEFTRHSVRARQQENLDSLIRRLEAQAQSQASVSVANAVADGRAQQAQAVMQQQQIQLRSQIARLKTFRSNGRLALELEPRDLTVNNLPNLALEDGDRVVVPAAPGFVSVFGSVNNENVIIYKPGKTVGEVIRAAGLTEDAEPDYAFILRADGTIVARRDRGSGFLGLGGFESIEMMPGDTVVVPAQMDRESRYNFVTRVFTDWTRILSNLGLGLAALKTLKNM